MTLLEMFTSLKTEPFHHLGCCFCHSGFLSLQPPPHKQGEIHIHDQKHASRIGAKGWGILESLRFFQRSFQSLSGRWTYETSRIDMGDTLDLPINWFKSTFQKKCRWVLGVYKQYILECKKSPRVLGIVSGSKSLVDTAF